MPTYTVTVRQASTYEVEATTEEEASELVRSAVRGERVLVPTTMALEDLEVSLTQETPVPATTPTPIGPPRDPRDDPDDPIVRMPRIL
jgi:hypothetical protein